MLKFFSRRKAVGNMGRNLSMMRVVHNVAEMVIRHDRGIPLTERLPTFFPISQHEHYKHNMRFSIIRAMQQKTEFSEDFSDHLAAISVVGEHKILMLNMMKQCKPHNNGFSAIESDEVYQLRIGRVITGLIHILKENPDITIIALQESPIDEDDVHALRTIIDRYLSGWETAEFGMTDFGVMTFIRTERFTPKFHVDGDLASALDSVKLADRCQTFANDHGYKFSNIHVPHGRAEGSLKIILEKIVDDAIAGNLSEHDIAGDFNCDATQVARVLEKVWEEKCHRHLKERNEPLGMRLSAQFDPSIKGHRKADGSKIDADGILSLKFERSHTHTFRFEEGELAYLIPLILGGGTAAAVSHADSSQVEEDEVDDTYTSTLMVATC